MLSEALAQVLAASGVARLAQTMPDSRARVVLGVLQPRPAGFTLVQHEWAIDSTQTYFYPASAVKLLAIAAALSRLSLTLPFELDFDRSTITIDTGSPASIGTLVRRIGLVSCNPSYNTLFDALGADGMRQHLDRWGIPGRLTHHLSPPTPRPLESYLNAPASWWKLHECSPGTRRVEFHMPARAAREETPTQDPSEKIGREHVLHGVRHAGPLDFTRRNRIQLADLQRVLCACIMPWAESGVRVFLNDRARLLVTEALAQTPAAAAQGAAGACLDADESRLADSWGKLFLTAARDACPGVEPSHVSKFGQAYGFTTENALLRAPGKPDLFLAASIHTNPSGVVGGDQYEYEFAARWLSDVAWAVLAAFWT